MAKALILFSGGMDSTICLFQAKQCYEEVEALFFDYGQRHGRAEFCAAWKIAEHVGVPLTLMDMTKILSSKSPLTDKSKPMDVWQSYEEACKNLKGQIEPAFVPMRNTLFLDIAVNYAMCHGIRDIYLGISKEDGATVPDCSSVSAPEAPS